MLKRLLWDSDFLGLDVASIDIQDSTMFLPAEAYDFDLIYLFSNLPLDLSMHKFKAFDIMLVDEKLTYEKLVTESTAIDPKIISLPFDSEATNHLLDLALESGLYSRFRFDSKYPVEKFRRLYHLWLINSLNRSLAEEFFVYKSGNREAGFITVGQKNGHGFIGLISVDKEFRGNGIGRVLLKAADYFLYSKYGTCKMRVITQALNRPACKLYEVSDYRVVERKYVYHLWKSARR